MNRITKQLKIFIDWYVRDKKGNVVLFQVPNLPITIWFISILLSKITHGTTFNILNAISFGALFTWSWLEIFQGSTVFRRTLGIAVMIVSIKSYIS